MRSYTVPDFAGMVDFDAFNPVDGDDGSLSAELEAELTGEVEHASVVEEQEGINLHKGQTEVYKDLFIDMHHRFIVVRCARGWGKTYMAGVAAATAVFELLSLKENIPNKVVYIIAPTYDQVVDIYYPLLMYDLGLETHVVHSSRNTGRLVFPGKVELRLLSYEAVERMRGKGAYFVVWDEVSSCKKGLPPKKAWQSVIQPCIITRWSQQNATKYGAPSAGRALVISTPKGYNFFAEMCHYAEADARWEEYHYDYHQSPYIDAEEVELVKHNIDPVEFASEYLASIEDSGNNVFYCFDRKVNVRRDIEGFFNGGVSGKPEDVHVAIDFNVGIQASSAWAVRAGQLHCIAEFKGHPDTETLAISLSTRYKGHKIYAYPDASGRARKSSAAVGTTDFTILQSYGIVCLARTKQPPIIDSVNCVNRHLKTAAGSVNMFIHPDCKGVIASLERTKWVDRNPDTATIDKSEGIEHFSDGIRYLTEYLFPVNSNAASIKRGFKF